MTLRGIGRSGPAWSGTAGTVGCCAETARRVLAVVIVCNGERRQPHGRAHIHRHSRLIFNERAYLKVFHKARAAAFTPAESASLSARRPHYLRHAAVSTWLNAGVPAAPRRRVGWPPSELSH
jgi:hypothetical protein